MQEDDQFHRALTILHIASGDLWAGAETQLYYLATALTAFPDIKLHVVLLNDGILNRKLTEKGVTVTVLDEANLNAITILIKLIKLIYKINPDVIHTHRFKENILGSIAALSHKKSKYIRTIHGGSEYEISSFNIKRKIINGLNKITGEYVTKTTVYVSHELRERLSKPDNSRHIVIENGVGFDEIKRNSESKILVDVKNDGKKVAFIGRLVSVKRLDIFLKIAELIRQDSSTNIKFYIIGDGPLKSEVSQAIISEDLGDIVFELGFLDNPLPVLKKMDYLMITSDHEGLPMSLLEAMYLKVLVISHNVGGIGNVMENNKSGILIDTQNPEEYADSLKKVLSNDVLYKSMVEQGHDKVVQNYSAVGNAMKYIEIYQKLNN